MRVLLIHQGHPVMADWYQAISRLAEVRTNRVPRHASSSFAVVPIQYRKLQPRRFFGGSNARLWARAALKELVDLDWQPDLVHGHFASACYGVPYLAEKLGIPYVLSEHTSRVAHPFPGLSSTGRRLSRVVYSQAAMVLPVASYLVDPLISLGAKAERVTILPNAVDTKMFQPGVPTPGRILCISRLVPSKQVDLLIRSMVDVCSFDTRAHLWVIGDGPERTKLESLASSLGLADRIEFQGALPRSEIAAVLRTASIFATSSTREGHPAAILEALASGVPFVAPALEGLEGWVDSSVGRLFRPNDGMHLVEAIREMLDPSYAIRSAARNAALACSVSALSERLMVIYGHVLASD